ncbi:quaternary amine ABC transporter ATP-binding protein [Pseudogemmobacter humi]|uniref:Quaternary amine transport ATP-binding protein n=1 Tax=Pseudogemmobacter humi TaxID=2483812 RepID=A0A3P5WEX6_9RHOB|nr:betaine/proline/choline family ABC transporter ATP-binding protein [Pseudogemmobacter humi]VDC20258.1 Glycine betaine transport ATP-binding protein OpuAA [Pseudogemmobacter humi]
MSAPAIECRGVYKLFGNPACHDEVIGLLREGRIDRTGAQQRFGCIVAVNDASFAVPRGEIFCIMGLSGSGKSTLIRHINRLIEPTAGEIFIDGRPISGLDAGQLRELRARQIGMVFQNMALLPHRSVIDNAALALELRGDDPQSRRRVAASMLARVGLAGWHDSSPAQLSGGMQQRVGLARALAADPQILLMDEPFSALDPLIRRQLQDEFRQLSTRMGKTTLFITHDLDEAIRIGDRIAIMKDGEICQTGTPAQIVGSPANDYVAEFVRNISRLHLVTAGEIAAPTAEPPTDARRVAPGAPLAEVIDIMAETGAPVAVAAPDGTAGLVTPRDVLRALAGRPQ